MSSNFVSVEKMAEISENQSKIVERLLSSSPTVDDTSITLNKLPSDIIEKIVCNYKCILPSKYVLREWVKKEDLDWSMLSENPCAIDLLKEKIEQEKSMDKEDYKKLKVEEKINWIKLSMNSEAIDILKKYPNDITWCSLCDNKNPLAVDMIFERMEYEKQLPPYSIEDEDYDEDNDEDEASKDCYFLYRVWIDRMCYNENPRIIELLRERIELEKNREHYMTLNINEKIDWVQLSSNPHPKAIELLAENLDKVDWTVLSENPGAIELLKANPHKILWRYLSLNKNASELLKQRHYYENSLSVEEYYSLGKNNQLSWEYLSANPCAIELLKANPARIHWEELTRNPEAIEMLKNKPRGVSVRDFYIGLSVNPFAIEILEKNKELINWKYLSMNPNATELLKERAEYESTLKPEQYKNLGTNNRIDWRELSKSECIFKIV
jgi:hypothetical protein